MLNMHDENKSSAQTGMRQTHIWGEKTLLVGMHKQAYIGFNETHSETPAGTMPDAFMRKRT
ncbi:hypothetical protein UF64_09475 [Thalassospira sp. HJ]|nr:hypothetical protein UF64_09475 [Thalassospira sp. HJ]